MTTTPEPKRTRRERNRRNFSGPTKRARTLAVYQDGSDGIPTRVSSSALSPRFRTPKLPADGGTLTLEQYRAAMAEMDDQ